MNTQHYPNFDANTDFDDEITEYEIYEEEFDPMQNSRQARRKRKPKARHVPKKSQQELLVEMAGEEVNLYLEDTFKTTYRPSLYESEWLLSSLRSFYEQDLITDVLAQVKGGKEASVYRCAASSSLDVDYVAAKVYRPRKFRSLTNDSMYREGRHLLSDKGEIIDNSDQRTMRAVSKNSTFGQQVAHTSWLTYEFQTLQTLYQLGANVPKPIEVNENSILMSYHGDGSMPAATLNKVHLDQDEAHELFRLVIHNIDLMLEHDMIHGDLSPYNILYWEGEITLIDFPQVTNSQSNPQADFILRRDIERVCEYFAKQGVKNNPDAIFNNFWQQYVARNPEYVIADHWIDDDPLDDDDDFDENEWD